MNRHIKKIITVCIGLAPGYLFAQGGPKQPSEASNPYAIAMIAVAAVLLLAIVVAAQILLREAKAKITRIKKETVTSQAAKIASIFIFCMLTSAAVFAQDAATAGTNATATATKAATTLSPLSYTSFYGLLTVIAVELLILLVLLYQIKTLMAFEEEPVTVLSEAGEKVIVSKEAAWKKLWSKLNSFRPIKEEATIDLGHDYDGIRELDNRLPPWWLYGFYISIIFAGIYLWRYHVSHTAPSSKQEYEMAMQQAAEEKAAYLAKSKNNVDENTAKLLTDAADLEAGKKVFTTICAACHAPDGGGGAGPNLTDDYWLHGGSIRDVFKTITYGWPDKGMRSWKDDYSPLQIEQIASYVKSLHGTKPASPKPPQGELFQDSTNQAPAATDSIKGTDKKTTAFNN